MSDSKKPAVSSHIDRLRQISHVLLYPSCDEPDGKRAAEKTLIALGVFTPDQLLCKGEGHDREAWQTRLRRS
jgi:hypothetical protein